MFAKYQYSLVFIAFCLVSCAGSQSFGDDDAINRRSSYQEDDHGEFLPSPKQVADESKQALALEHEQKMANRQRDDAVETSFDSESEIHDYNVGATSVFVPSKQQEESLFIQKNLKKNPEAQRRRPVFLKNVAYDKIITKSDMAFGQQSATFVTGGTRMAARVAPGQIPVREGMGTYLVQKGDTLSSISLRVYGTTSRWMEIAHLNRLGDGSIIFPHEVIYYVPVTKP